MIFGKASGFSATLDLSRLNGSDGFRLDGVAANDYSGISVSSAGDVNGDGFADVIVGALETRPSNSSYVVFGKAAGFSPALVLSNLNGSNGFRLNDGASVSSAGDVNGDGFDDMIVGAPAGAHSNGSYSSASYVVFGKASGFSATLDLFSLNGSNGFRLDGEAQFGGLGHAVSSAGDVDGDGFDDVIVGARFADPNGYNSGSSYVIFGKASGFSATLDLSRLNGSDGFRVDGLAQQDFLGETVSGAGDFNGDGFDDLMVTTQRSTSNADRGGTYIILGKASGFDAAMALSDLDSSNFLTLNGLAPDDGSIEVVSGAGDVNGDGFDDVMMSLPYASPNGNHSGSSYVIFGGNFTDAVTHSGTSGNDNLTGTSAAERFVSGNGSDIMTGGGGADVFHGGAGDDIIQVSNLNFQLVDGGTGNDTLVLTRSNMNLNLTSIHGELSDIEVIDLHGTGSNTLTLTPLDVLNLSDSSNTLKVDGNAGDRVDGLSSGWTDGGVQGDFHAYTDGAAILLVGVNMTTDFV